MMEVLSGGEKILTIHWYNTGLWQTDRKTPCDKRRATHCITR